MLAMKAFLSLFAFAVVLMPGVQGKNEVGFYSGFVIGMTPTSVYYMNQTMSFDLGITYNDNLSSYDLDFSGVKTENNISGRMPDDVYTAGKMLSEIAISQENKPGHYNCVVYFNYTTMDGVYRSERYDLPLDVYDPIKIDRIPIPLAKRPNYTFLITTDRDLDEVVVEYNMEGNVDPANETLVFKNMSKGIHSITTNLTYYDDPMNHDPFGIGFKVTAKFGNITIGKYSDIEIFYIEDRNDDLSVDPTIVVLPILFFTLFIHLRNRGKR
jgi:hypothetical protein